VVKLDDDVLADCGRIAFRNQGLDVGYNSRHVFVINLQVERLVAEYHSDSRDYAKADSDVFGAIEPKCPIEPAPCFVTQASLRRSKVIPTGPGAALAVRKP
jgi:hypothetical protein